MVGLHSLFATDADEGDFWFLDFDAALVADCVAQSDEAFGGPGY